MPSDPVDPKGLAEQPPVPTELHACRTIARGSKLSRIPRSELHGLVARCMAIAERCLRDHNEMSELYAAVRVEGVGLAGRRYVEADTDAYLLVCRHVFDADRSRGWRFAAVMREAAGRQIQARDLTRWLADNGGMNALFLARPLTRTTVATKTIRLTKQIILPKHSEVTLTLRRESDGTFAPLLIQPQEVRP